VASIKRRSGSSWVDVWPTGPSLAVTITNHTVNGVLVSNDSPPPAFLGGLATISFLNTGELTSDASKATGGTTHVTYSGEWLTSGDNNDVDIRVTATGTGGTLTGTTGAWLSLASDRVWSLDTSGSISGSRTLTVQLRNATTLTVLDTATITLNVS
jgi:hypothetical protein